MRGLRSAIAIVATSVIAVAIACTEGVQPEDPRIGAVELTPAQRTVEVGARASFDLALRGPDGGALDPAEFSATWSTSRAAIATVAGLTAASAEVLGVAPGQATISVLVGGRTRA